MKDKIIEILEDVMIEEPEDINKCTDLIDGGYLDSMDVVSLVMGLNEEFNVNITASELKPENFNSVAAIERLITDLR